MRAVAHFQIVSIYHKIDGYVAHPVGMDHGGASMNLHEFVYWGAAFVGSDKNPMVRI